MTILRVFTDECPKVEDGRTRHYFVSKAGRFACQNCGEVSNPAQRWESPRKQEAV